MKRLFLFLALALPLCSIAQKLKIAVAANAQFVSQKLAEAFKKETGIETDLIIGSSGKLTTQIEQGAPFEVFLSADMRYPQELSDKGFTIDKPKEYAYGKLVVWTLKNSSINKGITSLTSPDFAKIAVGNPQLAPYGEAAIQAMNKLKLYDKLKPKIVYGESISQVNQYLLSGAADVALTAKSIVLDPGEQHKGKWVEVDEHLYKPIAQGVVILKSASGKNLANAQRFCHFLFSKTARAIFNAYGYK